MTKTILLIEPTIRPIGVEYLTTNYNVVLAPNGSEETIIEYINKFNVHALIVRTEKVTKRILDNCPTLEVIGMHGVGLDNIDVASATENGVMVLNAPFSNYTSVAEHSIMSILALSRNLPLIDKKVRNGEWNYRDMFYPMEINAKNLLIVGMGKIGQELTKKAKAFNLNVFGFDPFLSESEMKLHGVLKVEKLEEYLPKCDFISLHAPLTKSTYHMFSSKQFELMRNTAFIINLGRGSLINEEALLDALVSKKIGGAALDVLEEEPPNRDNPLFKLDNVILSPHFGGDTLEAKDRCSESISKEVCKVLSGEISKNLVNNQVLGNARARKSILKGVK
ncbi:hydroxyacid dehydrogenase [Cytobacillus purgationiresistens]|uniref:D-3-phosphoglycerate dehydrogenase n=1 Tax=Cytobacillus purgationiresistens TaxID=863449 RepID=A0ABU0AN41_9BACI|nr:hydroxyacid dehydrogenase [Cytobacillus purgationiresistens]MDQ0272698.1 D-3-phosphoglycerate dehydrogenase [Cytobacillus purgationiresistens]